MTSPHSETPLRRSAVGSYRKNDEAERQEAHRRTPLVQQDTRKSSALESIEENETIRSCVDLYNCDKLSKDTAWDTSLIDSLATLMDRHHKQLNNFKMAGYSLEASAKVYGLRVDSIYKDALRISAGLNARPLKGLPEGPSGDGEDADAAPNQQQQAAPKPKRQKRNLSTVTKNKETLNARLDMVPMQEAILGKINSTVGSLDASARMIHNILPSVDFEMRLRPTNKICDDTEETDELMDSETLSAGTKEWTNEELCNAEWLPKLYNHMDKLNLRPLHTGYVITSAPNPKPQSGSISEAAPTYDDAAEGLDNADDFGVNPTRAPGIKVSQRFGEADLVEGLGNDTDMDGGSHHDDSDTQLFDNEHFTTDDPVMNRMAAEGIEEPTDMMNEDSCEDMLNQSQNIHEDEDTILEISTEFKDAPRQITKVIVPFEKRSKVIDMKNLKKCCNSLIQKQLLSPVFEASIPSHPVPKEESYAKGTASFQEVYRSLPDVLSDKMKDSLSPSVALYAVLHLANDMKLRLIPQENLEDFQIRQVLDDEV
ncbi:uncharacterized protein LOC117188894 [Drosophila miranda]|uniref:uncharacterized protein LOC117188894 n=1 Tax=Drosophila miranda TaxID=7229 RepID=UPI00143F2CD1|nr:uncharacterized protein LOC117188894 [Drosophila miranda]XP_033249332.1 uncharacterized protein LOC117188894 [Drosophila miranda]